VACADLLAIDPVLRDLSLPAAAPRRIQRRP